MEINYKLKNLIENCYNTVIKTVVNCYKKML